MGLVTELILLGVFGEQAFPALDQDLFADSGQTFFATFQFDLGSIKLMRRKKLCEVVATNQFVDLAFLFGHPRQVRRLGGGDDAVVRGDLGIVPHAGVQ
ncbi:hypothetical protein D3C72_1446050 [compost metagenome]